MKIALIMTNNLRFPDGTSWADKNRRYAYAPTTLSLLAALVPKELDAEIELLDEGVQHIPEHIDADLIALSATTPNAPRAYEIAAAARKKGITVVMGGYHATLVPQETLAHVDAVVRGYAEESWPRLLRDFAQGRLERLYEDHSFATFESAAQPFPRRDLLKPGAYFVSTTMEATRCCVNPCNFCVINTCFERKIRKRPVESVVDEITAMGARHVLFFDSNPTEDLEYIIELYKALTPLGIRWYSNVTFKIINNDTWLEWAVKSGCQGVMFGFESVNQDSLDGHRKSFYQVQDYKKGIRKLHDHGIFVLGCFVFGLEKDTPDIFARTAAFATEAKIDLVQYAIFTPFPGTPIFKDLEKSGRILTRDWNLYDGKNVVFKPNGMTPAELQRGFHWAWRNTYSMNSIARRHWPLHNWFFFTFFANLGFRFFGKAFVNRTVAEYS